MCHLGTCTTGDKINDIFLYAKQLGDFRFHSGFLDTATLEPIVYFHTILKIIADLGF